METCFTGGEISFIEICCFFNLFGFSSVHCVKIKKNLCPVLAGEWELDKLRRRAKARINYACLNLQTLSHEVNLICSPDLHIVSVVT